MFNIANLFTAANMLSGILAILLAIMGRIDLAPFAIFAGAIFDFLDGFIARLTKSDGELGKQMDSLADMITFGVAPGIIMMVIMTMDMREFINSDHLYELINYSTDKFFWGVFEDRQIFALPFFALFIPFFSMFRLAKFNVDKRQTNSFIGLPTPALTLFFMAFPLVLCYSDITYSPTIQMLYDPINLSVLIIVMSLLMVVPLPMFSLKFKTFGWKSNEIRYTFLLISTALILIFQTWSIALIVILYLILSLIGIIFLKKKKDEI
ncbi:MAG: CDP-alcohol phosphatidyltransferase family protein [Crocinitomicaceae bacterium]|nr:CDP-alcohol phosphatidyltransferase family protein [Crocinitomicaceae bacterium]